MMLSFEIVVFYNVECYAKMSFYIFQTFTKFFHLKQILCIIKEV